MTLDRLLAYTTLIGLPLLIYKGVTGHSLADDIKMHRDAPNSLAFNTEMPVRYSTNIVSSRYSWVIHGWEHNWVVPQPGFTICDGSELYCEWVELPGPKVLR